MLVVGDNIKITNINFFDIKCNRESHDTQIPKWWKITTKLLLDERISELEYLRDTENSISKNIIMV